MALTDNSDVFASLHEMAINNVVLRLQQQRPSLFNYGTLSFVRRPDYLCNQTIIRMVDPDVRRFGNPVVTEEPLLGIPGYTGPFGLEYCFQLAELSIDFHPGNVHTLPPELAPPLKKQRFSLKARVCAGLSCPGTELLIRLAPDELPFNPKIDTGTNVISQQNPPKEQRKDDRGKPLVISTPTQNFPFDPKNVLCFCIDLFAVLHVEREGSPTDPIISLKLDNLELVDIKPEGLENSAECYMKTVLIMGILPKVRLALNALVFSIENVLTIGPTPISAAVPFNPSIQKDQIEVFVDLT